MNYISSESFRLILHEIYNNLDTITKESNKDIKRAVSPTLCHILRPHINSNKCRTDLSMLLNFIETNIPHYKGKVLEEILEDLLIIEKELIPSLNTLKTQFTKIRNWSKENLPEEQSDLVCKVFRMDKDSKIKIREDQEQSRLEGNEIRKNFKMKDINRVFNQLENSHEIVPLILLVMMCTGRRFVETLISGFKEIEDDKHHILFDDRAKQKKGKEYPTIRIPIIFLEAHPLLLKISELREKVNPKIEGLTKKQLSSKYNEDVNDLMSELFGFKCHSHELRKLYAVICYKKYGHEASFNAYIRDILGHDNLDTSLNYTTVMITED